MLQWQRGPLQRVGSASVKRKASASNCSASVNRISSFSLSSIQHQFRSASHSVPYWYRWRSMIGHMDGSVLNDDTECPGRGSSTPAVQARSSSSQPVAVGSAAGRPG